MHFNQLRKVPRFVGPFDPCPPMRYDTYMVPPNHFITFQPPNLPQFSPREALYRGTLWPLLYSPYEPGWG